MAKAATKKKAQIRTAAEAKAKRSIGRAVTIIGVAGFICILFLPTMMLLLAGMTPTIVAYMVDTNPKKYAARTVGFVNFSGCMPVASELWAGGHTIDFGIELLADPINWLIMLGAAAVGWALYFALPPMVSTYLSLTFERRIKSETDIQTGLVKEWGRDVASSAPHEELARVAEEEEIAKERAKKARLLKPKGEQASEGGAAGDPDADPDLDDEEDEAA